MSISKTPSVYKIRIFWDDEGKQWIAESKNFKGFAINHKSYEELLKYIEWAVPDFLEITDPPIEISTEKRKINVRQLA